MAALLDCVSVKNLDSGKSCPEVNLALDILLAAHDFLEYFYIRVCASSRHMKI